MATNIYLLATYFAKPRDPSRTKEADYLQDPANMQYDEQVLVKKGLGKKDYQNNVILDLTGERIVKNTFESGGNFAEVFKHYYDSYGDYINSSVNTINSK